MLGALRKMGVPNVVGVGIGYKNALRAQRRKPALIFVVDKKVPDEQLKPRQTLGKRRRMTVRIGAGKSARRITLATDVVRRRRVRARPCGAKIVFSGQKGSAGPIVRIIGPRDGVRYAVLTCGHLMFGRSGMELAIERAGRVDATSPAILHRMTRSDWPYDVNVIELTEAKLRKLNDTIDPLTAGAKPLGRWLEFSADSEDGRCRTATKGTIPIDILAAINKAVYVKGFPRLQDLFFYNAAVRMDEPFTEGTSGAAVTSRAEVMIGLHIAAAENWTLGVGQAIGPMLEWLAEQMGVGTIEVIGYC
ncbi:MAG TPA: hypothetical protein PKB10_01485 [Tepidisphaeraceae bacterium]|nr:hypothetical protein [Tepidisphaeraceae bacterium]